MTTRSFEIIINTYNRPEKLNALLDDIFKQVEAHVTVFNDGSHLPYNIPYNNVDHIRCNHHGKKKYWKLLQKGFYAARAKTPDYFIWLPDDVRLTDNFFDEAVRLYEKINDPDKICLTLRHPKGRDKNWTNFEPVNYDEYRLIQWVDMLFIAEKKFFEALNYKMNPIEKTRWDNNPKLGSGVGEQLSKRLLSYSMYQVLSSLVITPDPEKSQMNPEDRKINPVYEHYNNRM